MPKSILVEDDQHIEVKAHFNENEDGFQYLSEDSITTYGTEGLTSFIGLFKYPNYRLHSIIMRTSTQIDEKSNVIFVHPKILENTIIENLLFAVIDDEGNRTDIIPENRKKFINATDPAVMGGLYYEFRKKCRVEFA